MPDFFRGEFDPALPVALVAGLAGIAALLTLVRAISGKPLRPAWLQGPVVLLRWAALALLAIIILNPSESITLHTPESRSLVLLDGSASMSLGKPSRWHDAAAWTTEYSTALTKRGLPAPELRVFGTGARP